MYKKDYHIHFVGIGGIGMSAIAELLLAEGYKISGSDIKQSDLTDRLSRLGAHIEAYHAAEHVKGADVVVISSAVKDSNPEVMEARKLNISVIQRAEMLAELLRPKFSIAIAGAHGKTTTTAIVSSILEKAGLDPTIIIGGKLKGVGVNAKIGKGNYVVAEADESDGSLLKLSPSIAVVTNIDLEHLDFYSGIDSIKDTFLQFIDNIPFYGCAVLCVDNEHVAQLIPKIQRRYITYGIKKPAQCKAIDIYIESLASQFKVVYDNSTLGEVRLSLPGMHNVYNSLACICVALEIGIPFTTIQTALNEVKGAQRRLEIKGDWNGVMVMDDYGHHPTEIITTIETIKHSYPQRKLWVVFQPHRYTRTKALFYEFVKAFGQADSLILMPIYSATEQPIEGMTSKRLFEAIKAAGQRHVYLVSDRDEAVALLQNKLATNDILLTLGAGDVWQVGEMILS